MARFKQFIANYWRGQVGFATVAMLNVIFLAICLFFPFGATSEIWAFTSITLIGTCAVVVAIWMAIGAFRTGDRLTRENGGMMAVWALFALTLFAPFGASILTFKAALRHAAMVQWCSRLCLWWRQFCPLIYRQIGAKST